MYDGRVQDMANRVEPQLDLGLLLSRHLPVCISGTHLACLGLRFAICNADRLITTSEDGGQDK